jgi:D-alanyl-D-alanine carboxypeptidase (penicillin-binding protein 5/6)
MKNIFKILVLILASLASPVMAEEFSTAAKQAILIDVQTGTTLYHKEADAKMFPSSMTKIMTAYLLFEKLKEGSLKLDSEFYISEKAWRMGGSKMFVTLGERIKVEDLIRGILVQSGNDATIVVAEGLASSEGSFAEAITEKANKIGMTNSHFVNASGWPDPEHYSTARDLATMAAYIIKNFPKEYAYFSEKEFTYNNIKQGNRNPLLYRNIGADGMKTGHTEAAGYGLIGSATSNDRRVIIAINGIASEQERADEATKLLEWGLHRFTQKTIAEAGKPVAEAPVKFGKSRNVSAVLKNDVILSVPKISKTEVTTRTELVEGLIAPIKKDLEIGTFHVSIPGQETFSYPVYAASDIAEKNIFEKIVENAAGWLDKKKE